MSQKWYNKVTNQAALINSIPNIILVVISIITLIVSFKIATKQQSQSQNNFNKQMQRDSLLNLQEDSITRRKIFLTNLQLELLNRQIKNDSVISKKEFDLNAKKKQEADLMNQENLSINGVKLITYKTQFQKGFLDSVFGFSPDIIFKMNKDNSVNSKFQLLYRLVLYNSKSDSLIINIPVLQTLSEMHNYMHTHKIGEEFSIIKEFIVTCNLENKTQFPIKLNYDTMSYINLPKLRDTGSLLPRAIGNNLILYPGDKSALTLPFGTSLDVNLNKEFSVIFFLNYTTVFGNKHKIVRANFDPSNKTFVIYD